MSCSSPPHPCDYTSGCHDRICCRYMRRSDGLGRDRHHGKGYSNAPALLKYQRVIHPDLPASLITALMCRHHPRVPTIPTRRSPCANTRSHTSHLESLLGPWHTTVRLGISLNGAHHWPAPALPFIASVTAFCMPPIREGGWDVVAAGFLRGRLAETAMECWVPLSGTLQCRGVNLSTAASEVVVAVNIL
ncbi:uncharacterized protein LOC135089709 isoform X2 [Scylla paramamosain]|uniref:uncharacterized protein LOC135089709 isoform X2 n=1 Tax=Scylla paramamosain TaxID=85552 RepID=UPI003083E45C